MSTDKAVKPGASKSSAIDASSTIREACIYIIDGQKLPFSFIDIRKSLEVFKKANCPADQDITNLIKEAFAYLRLESARFPSKSEYAYLHVGNDYPIDRRTEGDGCLVCNLIFILGMAEFSDNEKEKKDLLFAFAKLAQRLV